VKSPESHRGFVSHLEPPRPPVGPAAAAASCRPERAASSPADSGAPAPFNVRRQLAITFTVAFVIRLVVVLFTWRYHIDPFLNHWRFAWEMGEVARSIATGHGFGSPYAYPGTGPTAILPPLYPYLIAGVFRIFGVMSAASALVLLGLNCLFSALTAIPIFAIARRLFGWRTALWSSRLWAVIPYAIFLSATRIWENALTTLLVTTALALLLRLADNPRPLAWVEFGALAGVIALCNPIILSVFLFWVIWAAVRRARRRQSWKLPAVSALLALIIVLTPWEIRNYRTFGKFFPIRSNFWAEMAYGNTGDLSDIEPDWAMPSRNDTEWRRYAQLGEMRYMDAMRAQALDFIRRNPGLFARLTVRRFGFVWTGFWSLHPEYVKNEPFQIPNTVMCSAITLLMLLGIRRAWCTRRGPLAPLVLMLIVMPLTYYISHPAVEYRHPMDPVILIFAVFAVAGARASVGTKRPLAEQAAKTV
jgi:4-amino-4-deoxy-L-arabinose transferase-like glycosyltransferase